MVSVPPFVGPMASETGGSRSPYTKFSFSLVHTPAQLDVLGSTPRLLVE